MHSSEVRTIFYKAPVKVATEVFYKTKAVLKNSAIFIIILTVKHLSWGLFLIKLFIKKRLQHRFFTVNVTKSLRTHILKKICKQLLLQIRTTAFECL